MENAKEFYEFVKNRLSVRKKKTIIECKWNTEFSATSGLNQVISDQMDYGDASNRFDAVAELIKS